ncbi:MAG: hypothetical protein ACLQJ0_28390 [Steroidobacteraceae bacterium]|jgi:hypothetical protein
MSDFQLTTLVALMIFNHRDTAEWVCAEISKAKPTKLLAGGDGARIGRQVEPHHSFFRFREELPEFYRRDQRIGQINGTNFRFGHRISGDS